MSTLYYGSPTMRGSRLYVEIPEDFDRKTCRPSCARCAGFLRSQANSACIIFFVEFCTTYGVHTSCTAEELLCTICTNLKECLSGVFAREKVPFYIFGIFLVFTFVSLFSNLPFCQTRRELSSATSSKKLF